MKLRVFLAARVDVERHREGYPDPFYGPRAEGQDEIISPIQCTLAPDRPVDDAGT